MLKAREILRLKHEVGLSLREIARTCSCGKSTVAEVLERAEKAGITWPIDCSDMQLMSLLYPDFDSCNLKTLIYQGIKSLFFVYSTTVSLRINLGIFIPKALNI